MSNYHIIIFLLTTWSIINAKTINSRNRPVYELNCPYAPGNWIGTGQSTFLGRSTCTDKFHLNVQEIYNGTALLFTRYVLCKLKLSYLLNLNFYKY